MRSIFATVALALMPVALARPQDGSPSAAPASYPSGGSALGQHGPPPMYRNCLTDADAKTLVDGYTYLLQYPGGPNFNSIANTILANNFTVYSDSINFLGQKPVSNSFVLASLSALEHLLTCYS
jgi:hypothetical protein